MKKILIANRGEIACRVIRTARKMGIATVAVYSDADRRALHVSMADEAVHIGPPSSSESYLVAEKILDAIAKTGADAVHPGYGFLSENAGFCRALQERNVTFIGPDVPALLAMGDKIASKELAKKSGVNTIPGCQDVIKTAEQAIEVSRQVGYPVMIKASAGGGGKGMRVAYNDKEAAEGWELACNEGRSYFKDDRVFIEKFIENPHHIEIQILADRHGNTLYLNERECSIQRRNQKVIEEAPSPFLDPATRRAMGEQAVQLARACNYVSAGTVEFVVGADKQFYFLEMNTRLQVEHPITEKITGLDLVEQMIRVARGEKLSFTQEEVKLNGWAMECRIYAEDPYRNNLPSVGRLVYFRPPAETPHVRLDTGVFEGGEVSIYYDPMIAKLVTWGEDRHEAIKYMRFALDNFMIRGPAHNIDFLNAIMRHKRFVAGNLSTNFIAKEFPEGFKGVPLEGDEKRLFAAAAACLQQDYNSLLKHIPPKQELVVTINEEDIPLTIHRRPGINIVEFSPEMVMEIADSHRPGIDMATFHACEESHTFQFKRLVEGFHLTKSGIRATAIIRTPFHNQLAKFMPIKESTASAKMILSPMPGLVLRILTSVGAEVDAGEALLVLEAMKMENIIRPEVKGKIKKIFIEPGDTVEADAPLIELE
ncbi:MAG: acetyl/propionyl/methylcrotonyl-CoA carboxylase subunit alpha [Magnetococcales bacterium]|nr:acetyl/propionyl/methylcrotonyl-CoA carboxylase subunit alpha [Magnetococcales bacterium]